MALFDTVNFISYCIGTTMKNKLVNSSIFHYNISLHLRYFIEMLVLIIFHLTLLDLSIHIQRRKYAEMKDVKVSHATGGTEGV